MSEFIDMSVADFVTLYLQKADDWMAAAKKAAAKGDFTTCANDVRMVRSVLSYIGPKIHGTKHTRGL